MDIEISKDAWGKDVSGILNKKLFLFDMDGTIYKDDNVFDGTIDLMRHIEEIGGKYVFITNNSSKSVVDYIEKVNRLGIKSDFDNFFTSSQASILFLKKNYLGKKVYCQGTKSLIKELLDAGINVTENIENDVQVILVGFDTEMTSEKLNKTCRVLQKDIPFIATNPDLRCPVEFGFIPDCGSICQMLENVTGRKPIYIGKPEPVMVDIVMEKFHYSPEQTVVIGDRLYTDIATGLNAGVTAICVLTGEASKDEIKKSPIKPHYTFESVKDIYKILKIK